ncbi:hypothetical protein [Paraburkholderia bannensis]|uniref:hypothetical protein n=1 Tax=Paraburkholderia bannensis TaxID=765414 RepID=UPI0012EBAE63|nr:hypothetical protein [Paraburkholderia bannensis]
MADNVRSISDSLDAKEGIDADIEQASQGLVKFIDEDPIRFVRLVCEGILGIDHGDSNPFLVKNPGSSDRLNNFVLNTKKIHGGFAQIILSVIHADSTESFFTEDFIPFFDLIAGQFSASFKFLQGEEFSECTDLMTVMHTLLEKYSGDLGFAIDTAAYKIFEGVPIYRKHGNDFQMLEFDDRLYVYIFKKGEFWETGRIDSVPDWVEGLYVKKADLDAHDAYFSGSGELTPDGLVLRRQALWSTLGIKDQRQIQTSESAQKVHNTRILDAVQAVIARYYGSQFNEADRSTYTTQDVVIEWLKSNFGLSQRQAEAVDIVTRPR